MININSNGTKIKHYWSKCIGAGRANEGLRSAWQKQLCEAVSQCGFEYIRFHGILHDDMCVYRVIDGMEIYNFQYIDELFDFLLSINIRPFVEFGFMPKDMASGDENIFWWKGNITPPANWNKWEQLIIKLVTHWIERYGVNEVEKWYFEVWNEPNLYNCFWSGTKSEYFNMYKITALAIKKINEKFKVGGPATSNFVADERFDGEIEDTTKHKTHEIKNLDDVDWKPVWIEDFLTYCKQNELPLDFISCHPYPTDFALDGHGIMGGRSRGVNSTKVDLTTIRNLVESSQYPDVEIHLTEWSSSPSPRDFSHDFCPAAAYVVKCNVESIGLVDSLSYWTFTDIFEEGGAGNKAFHGGFGLINYQGIKKPTFYAYEFLNSIGDIYIANGKNYIVTKNSSSNKISILIYNYNIEPAVPISTTIEQAEEIMSLGKIEKISLQLEGFKGNELFLVKEVTENSGCAMQSYKKLGYPSSPNIVELKLLMNESNYIKTDIITVNENGLLDINFELQPFSIMLISEI